MQLGHRQSLRYRPLLQRGSASCCADSHNGTDFVQQRVPSLHKGVRLAQQVHARHSLCLKQAHSQQPAGPRQRAAIRRELNAVPIWQRVPPTRRQDTHAPGLVAARGPERRLTCSRGRSCSAGPCAAPPQLRAGAQTGCRAASGCPAASPLAAPRTCPAAHMAYIGGGCTQKPCITSLSGST